VFDALVNAFRAPDIRKRIFFILGMLIIVRMLAHVPVPGIDREALEGVIGQNEFLQLINLFSGGGLQNFSIIALGVNPYINASIIMQLMTGVVPRLQQLSREGEYGRGKINSYTRYLTVPLAVLQSYGYLALLSSPQNGVVENFDITSFETLTQIITLTAVSAASATASASSSSRESWPAYRVPSRPSWRHLISLLVSPSASWLSWRWLSSSTSRKVSDASPSNTPAAFAVGACTRVVPPSCPCELTRPA